MSLSASDFRIWLIITILTMQPVKTDSNPNLGLGFMIKPQVLSQFNSQFLELFSKIGTSNFCKGFQSMSFSKSSEIGNLESIQKNFEDFFLLEYNIRITHWLCDGILALTQSTTDTSNQFIAEDLQIHGPQVQEQQRWKLDGEIDSASPSFQQVKIDIVELFAYGDRVVIYWNWHGIHLTEYDGIPSTGEEIVVPGFNVYGFNSDGQIDRIWGRWDKPQLVYH